MVVALQAVYIQLKLDFLGEGYVSASPKKKKKKYTKNLNLYANYFQFKFRRKFIVAPNLLPQIQG